MPPKTDAEKIDELIKENKALKDKFSKAAKGFEEEATSNFNMSAKGFEKYTQSIFPSVTALNDAIDTTKKNMSLFDAMAFLDIEATEIQNAFGVSKQRVGEFKQSIADLAPEIVQFGLTQNDAAKIIVDVGNALGTTGVVGQKALKEIGAASKVTGLSFEFLAQSFRDVGVSVYNVGTIMKDVTNYAKSVGVSVQAVSKNVVDNLDKMNIYNFENGIGGLTKMAAQSSRLGISMSTVFGLAEKVFNPEGAIEMAAGLQRLGVAAGDLLDPLRSMDLAANNPEELTNQLVELTKTFTKFSEKTNSFEIMPGEKRRLREIAQEMNIPIGELTKMSIKAAEFDHKLKKIQFPSFIADKETKELIAGMSQMKDGRAVIAIKDELGVEQLKETNQLTSEDIDKLKIQEEELSKTIEQLAIEQLDQLKMLNTQVAAAAGKTVLGAASTSAGLRLESLGNAITKSLAVSINKETKTEDTRKSIGLILNPLEKGVIETITSGGDITKLQEGFQKAYDNLVLLEKNALEGIKGVGDNTINTIMNDISRIYKEPLKTIQKDSNINLNITSDIKDLKSEEIINIIKEFIKTIPGADALKNSLNLEGLPQ